jgi:NADPH2:quinone reductase
MKAMMARAWGEPSALEYADIPEPTPGPGEVLIDVRASGCNFPDLLMVRGKYQVKPPLPFVPGLEIAGVVSGLGPGVDDVRIGQRVFALIRWGGYASRAVAPVARTYPLPDFMSFEEGAAFGLVYQTSWVALVHRARLTAGQTLLVHGAAGGVGLSAIHIGKTLGARVLATAGSPEKLAIARAAGADVTIDYQTEDWIERVKQETGGAGADVVYDPVGGDIFDGSMRCIAFEGRLLVVGFAGGRIADVATNRVLLKNISIVGVYWGLYNDRHPETVRRWMDELLSLVAAGRFRPVIFKAYPLPRAADALAALAGRESYGKVVLVP